MKNSCRSAINPVVDNFRSAISAKIAYYSDSHLVPFRVRAINFALACLASGFALLAAIGLAEGIRKGSQMLAAWVKTNWLGEQTEAVMEYAIPASIALNALVLILFASAMRAKKE